MRYSTVLFAFFAAVVLAQDDSNPIEDLGEEIGDIAEGGVEVLTSDIIGGVTSVLDDISEEATNAAESIDEASSSEEEEAAEIEEGSDQDSAVEEDPDAAAIAAIPVLGAGIAGALAVVGML